MVCLKDVASANCVRLLVNCPPIRATAAGSAVSPDATVEDAHHARITTTELEASRHAAITSTKRGAPLLAGLGHVRPASRDRRRALRLRIRKCRQPLVERGDVAEVLVDGHIFRRLESIGGTRSRCASSVPRRRPKFSACFSTTPLLPRGGHPRTDDAAAGAVGRGRQFVADVSAASAARAARLQSTVRRLGVVRIVDRAAPAAVACCVVDVWSTSGRTVRNHPRDNRYSTP
jgi:hypothetical protein